MDFAKLKKGAGSGSIEKLTKALESQNKSYNDDRYWNPTVDKAGNGFATIRFLDSPAVDGDDGQPFVQLWTHGFQGPSGAWYIENSLTTIGKDDPVSEENGKLWNSGIEANKNIARDRKRKLSYISNILVVKDPANPDNDGKVFLFKYGKKIFDKVKEKLGVGTDESKAEFADPDDKKFNPFNFWEGANFKLKIRKYEGYRNYDKSEFESQSALHGGDDSEIEKTWKKLYSLKEVIDPKNFKSYDDLKKKLEFVLGQNPQGVKNSKTAETTTLKETADDTVTLPADDKPVSTVGDNETPQDDDFDVFKRLASE